MSKTRISIKENVLFILKAKNMTQLELAAKIGVTKQNVQHLINGNITLEKLAMLADILNTTPAELVADPPLSRRKSFIERGEPTQTTLVCPACGKTLHITAEE